MGFKGWGGSQFKYGNKKTSYNGILFDSTVERDRYRYLEFQLRNGEISGLRVQHRFVILPQVIKIVPTQLKTKIRYDKKVVESAAHYTCDMVYRENDRYVVEDVKSDYARKASRDYPLRRHRMVEIIQEHNKKGRGQWIFRESVLVDGKLIIKDYEP